MRVISTFGVAILLAAIPAVGAGCGGTTDPLGGAHGGGGLIDYLGTRDGKGSGALDHIAIRQHRRRFRVNSR